jgi:hypothetical protein
VNIDVDRLAAHHELDALLSGQATCHTNVTTVLATGDTAGVVNNPSCMILTVKVVAAFV